jgi:hypothetical protein
VKRLFIWIFLIASTGACTTSRQVMTQSQLQVAPALTVERFLQAANQWDLVTMSRLFGTDDGPVAETWARDVVELRMDVLANILQHVDYRIVSERSVPGATSTSTRIGVDMALAGGATAGDVGFILVLESAERWLVNVVETVKITGADE